MDKKRVPIKNIKTIIVDIQNPNVNYEHLLKFPQINLTKTSVIQNKNGLEIVKKILISVFSIALAGVFIFLILGWSNLKNIKTKIEANSYKIADNFNYSLNAIKNMDEKNADSFLKNNEEILANLSKMLNQNFGKNLLNIVSNIVPSIKNGQMMLEQIYTLNLNLSYMNEILNDLKKNGLSYFMNNGGALIEKLEQMKTLIAQTNELSRDIKNNLTEIKKIFPFVNEIDKNDNYLKYSSELYSLNEFLDRMINFLKSNETKYIAILFQNPSEIRPGGGFLGSYAEVAVNNGQVKKIEAKDVYDADGQLKIKIIPPDELQTITENWGIRDANWFFDFPTSAKTTINFLNASKIYSEKKIRFEFAIAININLIKSILEISGPITADKYPTIDASNFLYEIQKETESGKDKIAGEPKRILKVLTPLLLEKINNFSLKEKEALGAAIEKHLKNKDILFYSIDPVIQNFFSKYEIDGGVYKLPDNFWGNYLGVVNANIAGGKSDAFIKEDISVNVDIDTTGNIFTNLEITRSHSGNTAKEWWWKADNNNFLQIFTEPNSTLVDVNGNDIKKKYKTLDYGDLDYAINPDLAEIQKNKIFIPNFNTWQSQQFGKNVFGTWFITKAGTSKTLKVRYQTNYSERKILTPGKQYKFIFEKQSGVDNSLNIKINAPFKYFWTETNSPVFTYATDNTEKRVIITLTLDYKEGNEKNNKNNEEY